MTESFLGGILPFIHNMDTSKQEGMEASTKKISENGEYDTTAVNKVNVNVESSAPVDVESVVFDYAYFLGKWYFQSGPNYVG